MLEVVGRGETNYSPYIPTLMAKNPEPFSVVCGEEA
jgi:hypothetical protein